MMFPANGNTFIPKATGQILDPLEMPPEEADALLGKDFMDAVRAASERMKERGPMHYVQIVPAPEVHAPCCIVCGDQEEYRYGEGDELHGALRKNLLRNWPTCGHQRYHVCRACGFTLPCPVCQCEEFYT